ncbi:hypothetical protein PAAG_11192 [Paracoccidioides lutzii Pb01]|uniref:Uncharacterized protein n=1 Tax=Paracoccidioides lutzii (strain ATCC MYA-826 / Pb01) TaxID=502779 RepID=A0A0A2V6P1_PARBA|nr:hypothetical protein PAAG_11192 [Paracoccidioides lutzii Pb01]KGQ02017.1 hypothetical protein PAAG_11192 [Paracoccidioides lutzii Pb01]
MAARLLDKDGGYVTLSNLLLQRWAILPRLDEMPRESQFANRIVHRASLDGLLDRYRQSQG